MALSWPFGPHLGATDTADWWAEIIAVEPVIPTLHSPGAKPPYGYDLVSRYGRISIRRICGLTTSLTTAAGALDDSFPASNRARSALSRYVSNDSRASVPPAAHMADRAIVPSLSPQDPGAL